MKGQKSYVLTMIKLIGAYALFTGVIVSVFLYFFVLRPQQVKLAKTPAPTVTSAAQASPTPSAEKFCGGIAGRQCPAGYYCKLTGNYPDAGGTCLKKPL